MSKLQTALDEALTERRTADAEALLVKHSSLRFIEWRDHDSLMHWAASVNYLEFLEVLCRLYPRLANYMRKSQMLPFMVAACKGHQQAFLMTFYCSTVDIDYRSTPGTALCCALRSNSDEMVREVLRQGANPGNQFTGGLYLMLSNTHNRPCRGDVICYAAGGRFIKGYKHSLIPFTQERLSIIEEKFGLDEDVIIVERYAIYFSRSLTAQLLLELSRPRVSLLKATQRRN